MLRLLSASLGWVPDEQFDRFFAWKHEQSPFGRSPAWLALDGEQVIGFRTFVRWEFDHPDGRVRSGARAVDTATLPGYQGRGIFRRLTLHAVDEMRAGGVDFIFNTPNEQSRPGYLKMGWAEVGRLSTAVRPTSPAGLARMLRSRVPADRWSAASTSGVPAAEVFGTPAIGGLLRSLPGPSGLRTRRSLDYLRWRYGFDPLGYRVLSLADDPGQGVAIFRLRPRGRALEAALCDVLVPDGDTRATLALERAVARRSGADYVIRLGGEMVDRAGYVRLPGQGPVLTWRPVAGGAAGAQIGDWDLRLGDIELF